jgi:hypothetical protein
VLACIVPNARGLTIEQQAKLPFCSMSLRLGSVEPSVLMKRLAYLARMGLWEMSGLTWSYTEPLSWLSFSPLKFVCVISAVSFLYMVSLCFRPLPFFMSKALALGEKLT